MSSNPLRTNIELLGWSVQDVVEENTEEPSTSSASPKETEAAAAPPREKMVKVLPRSKKTDQFRFHPQQTNPDSIVGCSDDFV